jgi:hypothetical protein
MVKVHDWHMPNKRHGWIKPAPTAYCQTSYSHVALLSGLFARLRDNVVGEPPCGFLDASSASGSAVAFHAAVLFPTNI